jgi:hypothetical protein
MALPVSMPAADFRLDLKPLLTPLRYDQQDRRARGQAKKKLCDGEEE